MHFARLAAAVLVASTFSAVPAMAQESATLKKIGYMHSEVGKS